ncbi:MAG: AAA family ATPase [Firmicutes bacterium]|nr:AAA family ATPase [Bacillota bacterium]
MGGSDRLWEAWTAGAALDIREAVAVTRPFLLDVLSAAVEELYGEERAPALLAALRERYLPSASSDRLPDAGGMSLPEHSVRFKTFQQAGPVQAYDHFLLRRLPNDAWSVVAMVALIPVAEGRYTVEAVHAGLHLALGVDAALEAEAAPFLEAMAAVDLRGELEQAGAAVGVLYAADPPTARNRAGEGRGPFQGVSIDRAHLPSLASGEELLRVCAEAVRASARSLGALPYRERTRSPYREAHAAGTKGIAAPERDKTLDDIARATYLPVPWLRHCLQLIRRRGQVVFYGPPGTGKTYVARQLALHLTQREDAIEVVQFHPSYAYEDFIEGIRPRVSADGTAVGFERADGLFKRFCARARELGPDQPAVMLIDEINRAPLSRVLGELLYLLEYRTETVTLPYSGERFSIPSNVILIGTMNSADRSISLVDYALRRRFAFIPFFPNEAPVRDVMRRFVQAHPGNAELRRLRAKIERVNQRLGQRHLAIGHSYLMRPDLDADAAQSIIQYDILPLVEEYFFDQPQEQEAIRRMLLDEEEAPEEPAHEGWTDGVWAEGEPPAHDAAGDQG